MSIRRSVSFVAVLALTGLLGAGVRAQVGAPGIEDLNSMPASALAALPGMSATIADAFVEARPFATIVAANTFLLGQKLTQEQLTAIYERAFVHLNLNTATAEEIQLIPRAGTRMAREFDEYRPWINFAQFDREIGKYVDAAEVNRLKQYVFIPLKLNTATPAEFMTVPGVGERMVREFQEYRPWQTQAQFEREIGKYVDQKEVARLWRFVTIQ
jgi:DNA uptake protein ComE-like DNA-binding protein